MIHHIAHGKCVDDDVACPTELNNDMWILVLSADFVLAINPAQKWQRLSIAITCLFWVAEAVMKEDVCLFLALDHTATPSLIKKVKIFRPALLCTLRGISGQTANPLLSRTIYKSSTPNFSKSTRNLCSLVE